MAAPQVTINDPRDIPGLVAWYSAEAETGYTDGQSMTQWTDQSGKGNHATGTGPTWRNVGGSQYVHFKPGAFSLPTTILNGKPAGSIVGRIRATGHGTSHWSLGVSSELYPYGSLTGDIYDDFGRASDRVSFPSTGVDLTAWNTYGARANSVGSRQRYGWNGRVRLTAGGTVGFPATAPRLGTGSYGAFDGDMSVVVIFDRELTDAEWFALESWIRVNPNGGVPGASATAPEMRVAVVLANDPTHPAVANLMAEIDAVPGWFASTVNPEGASAATLDAWLAANYGGADLLVVSRHTASVGAGALGWVRDQWVAGVPVFSAGNASAADEFAKDLGLVSAATSYAQQATSWTVLAPAHSVVAGVTSPVASRTTGASEYGNLYPSANAPYGTQVLQVGSDIGLVAIEAGDPIHAAAAHAPASGVAPTRAIAAGVFVEWATTLTADASKVLRQSLEWLVPAPTSDPEPFDPRDIPGLVAWYSAEHEAANYVDGAVVTEWTDLSGNNNHATPNAGSGVAWKATGGPDDGPRLMFAGTGYFTLPSVMAGATAGEAFASLRAAHVAGDSSAHWGMGAGWADARYPRPTDGAVVIDNFGHSGSNASSWSAVSPVPVTQWHRLDVFITAGQYEAWVDGNRMTYRSDLGPAFPTAPAVGANPGGQSGDAANFLGDYGALLIYNRKLNTTERAAVESWLAANPSGGTLSGAVEPPPDPTGATVWAWDASVGALVATEVLGAWDSSNGSAVAVEILGAWDSAAAATLPLE